MVIALKGLLIVIALEDLESTPLISKCYFLFQLWTLYVSFQLG